MSSIFTILRVGVLHNLLSKSPVPCGHPLFTVLHITLSVCVCVCVCVCACVCVYVCKGKGKDIPVTGRGGP
jgi:hypothetical protein